ncbi:MAG: hypothetical protein ACRD1H_00005, partial [Vicinamibacterales bacterium]
MTDALSNLVPSRQVVAWLVGLLIALAVAGASIRMSPVAMLALPVVVAVALVVMRWPWAGTLALIASVPVQQFGAFGNGAVSLTVTRASLPLAAAGLTLLWTARGRPLHGPRLALPFLALLLWMAVTAHVATDVASATSEIVRWLIALVAFLATLQVLVDADERVIAATIVVIAAAGALEAGLGTTLGLLGFGPESFLVQDAFSRSYGTFGRPNTFAGYLEMAIFPVGWFGLYRTSTAFDDLRSYSIERRAGFAASRHARQRLTFSI